MKRNLDLIREILLAIEGYEPDRISSLQMISPRDFSGTDAQNYHHIKMLVDASFIDLSGTDSQANHLINGMTMVGHDFLGAIREASVWESTKTRIGSAGAWTLDIVLAVAKEELKRHLGLGLQGG
jgi:hypothetical protein